MWSLKALCGIDEDPPDVVDGPRPWWSSTTSWSNCRPPPTRATARTSPSAADRLFHEAERKAPPWIVGLPGVPPGHGTRPARICDSTSETRPCVQRSGRFPGFRDGCPRRRARPPVRAGGARPAGPTAPSVAGQAPGAGPHRLEEPDHAEGGVAGADRRQDVEGVLGATAARGRPPAGGDVARSALDEPPGHLGRHQGVVRPWITNIGGADSVIRRSGEACSNAARSSTTARFMTRRCEQVDQARAVEHRSASGSPVTSWTP